MTIDIIVYLPNKQRHVERCVKHLMLNTPSKHNIFYVGDNLSPQLKRFISHFCKVSSKGGQSKLLNNNTVLGYKKSLHRGLQASTSDFVAILQSTDLVQERWLETLAAELKQQDTPAVVSRVGTVALLDKELLQDISFDGSMSTLVELLKQDSRCTEATTDVVTRIEDNKHHSTTLKELQQMKDESSPKRTPLVAVITPTRNRRRQVEKCIKSVSLQTYSNFEHIIVDDESTDATWSYLNKAAKRYSHIKVVRIPHEPQGGGARGRNEGIRLTEAKYICYVDDDDRIHPQHIETLVAHLEKTGAQWGYSKAEKRRGREKIGEWGTPIAQKDLRIRNYIPICSVMHTKKLIDEVGGFDTSTGIYEDWFLWRKFLKRGEIPIFVPKTTSTIHYGTGITSSRTEQRVQEVRQYILDTLDDNNESWDAYLDSRGANQRVPMVDIIIPVHGQLDLLQKCIKSIRNKTATKFNIILVDDASDSKTAKWMQAAQAQYSDIKTIKHTIKKGFTASINNGIDVSTSEWIILLNSDTIIGTPNWTANLWNALNLHENIGAAGPLSNHAGSQSIPIEGGCSLPPTISIDQWTAIVKKYSPKAYPQVGLVNGFCWAMKREVYNKVGKWNEARYPDYGSEDDYMFRLESLGLKGIVADDTFVYHKKSQSYKNDKLLIKKKALKDLMDQYGKDKVIAATPIPSSIRAFCKKLMQKYGDHRWK